MKKSINELNADLFHPQRDKKSVDPKNARKKGMDFLAIREYGHEELILKLQTKGYSRQISTETVEKLKQDGLQNDSRFAESYSRSRYKQGKGPARIMHELEAKKLPRKVIDLALAALEADWFDLAREVKVKKFGVESPVEYKEKSRQIRFLQSRGFNMEQISAAFKN